MFDWQKVVRRVARSRTDFTLITWNEVVVRAKVVKLVCNCCGAWAQQVVSDEVLERAYYPEEVYETVLEYLTLFLLRVDTTTGSRNADRRTVAGSGYDSPQKALPA